MLSAFISRLGSSGVLASVHAVTLVATFYMKSSVDRIAEKDFAEHCNDVQKKISDRLDDHARILLSGAAFFKASDKVTREEWKNFTQYQSVDKQLPGINKEARIYLHQKNMAKSWWLMMICSAKRLSQQC